MIVIEGIVEHGDKRGRELGFPTANIALPGGRGAGEPDDGVWAALVTIAHGSVAAAAVSLGRRRTFYPEDGLRLLEAHLLDVNEDLYGRHLRVELAQRLRPQRAFSDVQALIEQMRRDVEETRDWASSALLRP